MNKTSVWERNVNLPCPVYGVPAPQVWWVKDQSQDSLDLSSRHNMFTSNNTLKIMKALETDSGIYTCHAQNRYGSDSITYHLTVLGK